MFGEGGGRWKAGKEMGLQGQVLCRAGLNSGVGKNKTTSAQNSTKENQSTKAISFNTIPS